MITILWTKEDLPITFKKRYNFWRKQIGADILFSGFMVLLGTIGNKELK